LIQQRGSGRRGVDALFTRHDDRTHRSAYVGQASILVGIALWTVNVAGVERPKLFGPGGLDPYDLLVLSPLGILFIVSGVGVLVSLRTRNKSPATPSQLGDLENDGSISLSPSLASFASFRIGAVAFVEGLMIIALYAGVLDEYQSNPIMQDWVRRTLPALQILLSYEILIIVSAILGLLVVQLLPGRHLNGKPVQ